MHCAFFGGVWGVPPGGSGAPGWQNPGTRGLLRRSEGRPRQFSRKPAKTHIFGTFGGVGGNPRGVWGPSLADSRDPGPPRPVRGGGPHQFSREGFVQEPPTCPAPPCPAPALPCLPCPALPLPWPCPALPPCPAWLCCLPALPCCPCYTFEQPSQGARGEGFTGNPCFSSSGRHRPRGPTTRQ